MSTTAYSVTSDTKEFKLTYSPNSLIKNKLLGFQRPYSDTLLYSLQNGADILSRLLGSFLILVDGVSRGNRVRIRHEMLCMGWAGDLAAMWYSWRKSSGDLRKIDEKMAGKLRPFARESQQDRERK
jgi:hypothetical protein